MVWFKTLWSWIKYYEEEVFLWGSASACVALIAVAVIAFIHREDRPCPHGTTEWCRDRPYTFYDPALKVTRTAIRKECACMWDKE